jgi:hypothetical protein
MTLAVESLQARPMTIELGTNCTIAIALVAAALVISAVVNALACASAM